MLVRQRKHPLAVEKLFAAQTARRTHPAHTLRVGEHIFQADVERICVTRLYQYAGHAVFYHLGGTGYVRRHHGNAHSHRLLDYHRKALAI